MAKPETRWMPMDWAGYWRDTGHLSAAEHGAYLNLIGHYWVAGAPLKNNAAWLQRLAKCSAKEWKTMGQTILVFFEIREGYLHHKRIDKELAEARSRYERRANAGRVGGEAKAKQTTKQNPSNATAERLANTKQSHPHTTLVQSPNGDNPPSGDSARTVKAHRLPPSWKPSPESHAYATERNLTDAEITNVALPKFIRIFTSPDLRKPARKGWDRTWCNFIDDEAPKIIGNRARSSQSGPNRGRPGSVVDTVARLKAAVEGTDAVPESGGISGGGRWGESAGAHVGETESSGRAGGKIVEADDAERMYRDARGVEITDGSAPGTGQRSGRTADVVFAQTGGVSGGCGQEGITDPSRDVEVVADMGGTQGTAGPVRAAAQEADDGLDIPLILRR